jgi:hypothetical protein
MAKAAGNMRLAIRSNGDQVLAATLKMRDQLPAAQTAALTNLALAAVDLADTYLVRGHENPSGKSGSWYSVPVPGAHYTLSKPSSSDVREKRVVTTYTRDAKGRILDRKFQVLSERAAMYLFRDKMVSRTGDLAEDMSFDNDPLVRNMQLDAGAARTQYLLESGLGGLEIAAINGQVLLRTTATKEGRKMSVLEKRGAENGKGRPRYPLRRGLRSASTRYTTYMRKALAKLAAK